MRPLMDRRTKIIGTLGPASDSVEMLVKLIDAGLDVVRLNFSHGTYDAHARAIENVMEARRRTGCAIPILQDLQGPRIRIGTLAKEPVELVAGGAFTITTKKGDDSGAIPADYEELARDVRAGDRILIDDGLIELQVESTDGERVTGRVVHGGRLKSHKGMNLPGVKVSAGALTDKDLEDLSFGITHGVDIVALSFVRDAADVRRLKNEIASRGGDAWVVAKIERAEAVEGIGEIIRAADGIMVARGDLGVELPGEKVPALQKMIIAECNRCSTPVITATQMLESMVSAQRPTRAELTDVANAVLDGTDLVMLSAETSVGTYPVEVVTMMDRIIGESESHGIRRHPPSVPPPDLEDPLLMAVAHAACVLSQQVGARAIVPFTHSGRTAQAIAAYRPDAAIIAATGSERVRTKLNMIWGTRGLCVAGLGDSEETVGMVEQEIVRQGLLASGDTVVVTAGVPLFVKATTNMLRVHKIG